MSDKPGAYIKRRRPHKGEQVSRVDQTCIDTDDDDFEFEDARGEEIADVRQNDVSAFMVSKANQSKYQFQTKQTPA